MNTSINRFKSIHKKLFETTLNEIKGNINTENITYLLPELNIDTSFNENKLTNIIEARKFINDKKIFENIETICNYLLKTNNLNNENLNTLKSSITLYEYITKPNIKTLLSFRNYNEKYIKLFTDNKKYNIFTKVIETIFNGERDYNVIYLIESEILTYSLKDKIQDKLSTNELEKSNEIITKYSKITPLALTNYNKKERKEKIKSFYKSLTIEEKDIFSKFNIDNNILKENKHNKNKYIALTSIILTLLIIPIVSYNTFTDLKNENKVILAYLGTSGNIPKNVEKIEEENTNEIQEEIKEDYKEEPKIITYNYINPTGVGNEDMVNIALSQVGNIGGEPYWSWYGFSNRVEWCACFASWVANKAGISTEVIPKFSRVIEGLNWFVNKGLFRDKSYVPRNGDLIFFNYEYNTPVHVGIVEKVENGKVYTIEGNSKNDDCRQNSYELSNSWIYGYGTPNY